MTNTPFGFMAVVGVPHGPEEGTAVGWSPDGEALYVCIECESLHRKYENCRELDTL
jgi:hypothetical protein